MKINSIQTYNFHSINKPVNKTVQDSCQNSGMKELYPVGYTNNISFGARTNAQKLEFIGEDNFPNHTILNRYKQGIESGENTNLGDIHFDYYADLLNCETLEEAKELYPEFENVVDAKTLTDNFTTRSSFYKVKNGKYEGLTLENLSLKLLQSHYGKANPVNSPDKNFGINGKQLSALLQKLNVKELSKNYIMTIYRESDEYTQNASKRLSRTWQNPEFRQSRSEAVKKLWEDEEYKKVRVDGVKRRWQDTEFKEKFITQLTERMNTPETKKQLSDFMYEKWQDDSFRQTVVSTQSKRMTECWKDPEFRENRARKMEVYNEALRLAWEMHPEIKERMSEIALEFPALPRIIKKIQAGQKLTEMEKIMKSSYHKRCDKEMPDAKKIIAETQKEILVELKKKEEL